VGHGEKVGTDLNVDPDESVCLVEVSRLFCPLHSSLGWTRCVCGCEGSCGSFQGQCFFDVMSTVSASPGHGSGVGWPGGLREVICRVGGVVVAGGFR